MQKPFCTDQATAGTGRIQQTRKYGKVIRRRVSGEIDLPLSGSRGNVLVVALHRQRQMIDGRVSQSHRNILAKVPVHEPLYALLDREAWGISCNFCELIYAGLGFVYVSRLHRRQANIGGSPQASLNGSNQVEQLDGPLVSDVAEAHGRLCTDHPDLPHSGVRGRRRTIPSTTSSTNVKSRCMRPKL